ncbi:MAG: hydrogenase [Helicobacteraceae bacterium CG2_30_36_10]|nr:MAG: hydrogenase [Helicobacteraceae bacterium CG2_30_36_10]
MIDFFIGMFLATLISALFTTRLYRLLFWYSMNSLALAFLALYIGQDINDNPLIISGMVTLIFKAIGIPYFLKKLSLKHQINRSIPPNISVHYAIILIPGILVFTFYLAQPLSQMMSEHANYVAISISSLFLALILMMQHKSIAPKIIGFLTIENSLFLLATTATGGMPMIVELGIFFDLLMAIVIINLLFLKNEETA